MSLYRSQFLNIGRILIRNWRSVEISETRKMQRWVAPTLIELKRRRDKVGPEPLKPRSTFLEWNYEAEVFAFGKRLGEDFDKALLKEALTHRSYVNLKRDEATEKGLEIELPSSNETLIEEGHVLINDCIRAQFDKNYPSDVVSALVDYLTSEDMLAHVAKHMGLGDIIKTSEFPVENVTLASTFIAVVGALDKSQNTRTSTFINDFLICQLHDKEISDIWSPKEPLEYLENILKSKGIEEIEPRLCNQSAVNTILANYQVGLYNSKDKKLLGIGWGESIEVAKETAALNAIHRIQQDPKIN